MAGRRTSGGQPRATPAPRGRTASSRDHRVLKDRRPLPGSQRRGGGVRRQARHLDDHHGRPRLRLRRRSGDGQSLHQRWADLEQPRHDLGRDQRQDRDKTWIVCDKHAASPYYGNCYAQWDDMGHNRQLHMAYTKDGGATWTQSTVPTAQAVIGGQPLVQPSGRVVMPIQRLGIKMISFVSSNGGVRQLHGSLGRRDDLVPHRGRQLPLIAAALERDRQQAARSTSPGKTAVSSPTAPPTTSSTAPPPTERTGLR